MKKTIIVSLMVLLACKSAKLLTPTKADADRGAKTFPGLTVSDLDSGKSLFQSHCHSCHALKDPKSRTEEKWRKIVPVMAGRVNKKAGKTVLDDTQEGLILRYVVTMSTAPGSGKQK